MNKTKPQNETNHGSLAWLRSLLAVTRILALGPLLLGLPSISLPFNLLSGSQEVGGGPWDAWASGWFWGMLRGYVFVTSAFCIVINIIILIMGEKTNVPV